MGRRLRVGVMYGGRSGEHEISLRSAANVIRALDPAKYEVVPIAITRRGRWVTGPDSLRLLERAQRRLRPIPSSGRETTIVPEPTRRGLTPLDPRRDHGQRLDVVFPVLHGTYGEDGTIQGLLELAGIPYVGAGVLGSAVGMDKDVMKRLLRDAGLPVARFVTLRGRETVDAIGVADRIAEEGLGYPCFVKPANLGSSVGISKVGRAEELPAALRLAARYDTKVLVEEAIVGREFEIGVIGTDDLVVSVPGELIPGREFYDYVDKYVDSRARTIVPAPLPPARREEMAGLARRAYRALECAGMARVDFFLRREPEAFVVNEINTIPGFTAISLFPVMWEASGIPFSQVVDRLIALALRRHAQRARLTTSFAPPRPPIRAVRTRRANGAARPSPARRRRHR
jgi:D-alanine-D-alanine ligase